MELENYNKTDVYGTLRSAVLDGFMFHRKGEGHSTC